jgi:O-antigen ligase
MSDRIAPSMAVRDWAEPRGLAAQALCLLAVVLVGTDVLAITFGSESPLPGPIRWVGYLCIVATCFAYLRIVGAAAVCAPTLVALMLFVCASVTWSVDPAETARRLPSIVAPTLLGMLIGSALSVRGLVLCLAGLGVLVAVANLLAIAFVPEARGAPPWEDVWRGVFNHKNGLGGACAIVLPFMVYAALTVEGAWHRAVLFFGTVATLAILAASASRTAQITGTFAVLNLALAYVLRRRLVTWATATIALCLGMAALVALLFFADFADNVFRALGRKPTMSGRLPLWEHLWPWVEQRPWFGYGYSAFWDPDSPRVLGMAYEFRLRYIPWYSHSGVIETLLNVGTVGLMLMLVVIGAAFRAIFLTLLRRPDAHELALLLVFLVSFCLHNVAESNVLARDDMIWIIFVAIVVRLGALARAATHDEPLRSSGSAPAWPRGAVEVGS